DSAEPVENRIPVSARESRERRGSLRLRRESCCQVVGHFDCRRPGVRLLPGAVLTRALDGSLARRSHAAFGEELLGERHISRHPEPALSRGREAWAVALPVPPPYLTVDPAIAERFQKRFVVCESGRIGLPLLRKYEPHAGTLTVVALQPGAPVLGIGD